MHWRKFKVSEIPLDNFDKWLHDRWMEKDALLDHFYKHGEFPPEQMAVVVRTEVKLKDALGDVLSIFSVLALAVVLGRIAYLSYVIFGRR